MPHRSACPICSGIGDSGFLIVPGELVCEGRHFPTHGGATLTNCTHQRVEGMVPGMTCSVERWRRVRAILQSLFPIESALGIAAMAACAVVVEHHCAALDLSLCVPAVIHRLFTAAAD